MRTTIELPDDLRVKLVKLAAERGVRGYSELIAEALREYFARQEQRGKRIGELLERCKGILSDQEAEEHMKKIEEVWQHWES